MKDNFSVGRLLLFIAGIAVAAALPVLLFSVTTRGREMAPIFSGAFVLIFIGYALPLVFNYRKEEADSVIIGGTVYYKGIGVFTAVSLIALFLLYQGILPLGATAAVILLMFMVVSVYIYLTYMTQKHVKDVGEEEKVKKSSVIDLRHDTSELAMKLAGKFPENEVLLKKAKKISEDLRYLSPSDNTEAKRIEKEMSKALSDLIKKLSTGACSADAVEEQVDAIGMLYQQRKSIF